MSGTPQKRGWCPGALRPMLSGDGLIVRLRPRSPVLTSDLVAALAEMAETYGNGLIDLTARANLQLRGIEDARLPALQQRLADLGLLDPTPEQEAVRNLLVSPLIGLDPTSDRLMPVHRALSEWLTADRRLYALPGKFGFGLDDDGPLRLPIESSDLHLRVLRNGDGQIFAAGQPLGMGPLAQALPALQAVTLAFLARAEPGSRMKDFFVPADLLAASGFAETMRAFTSDDRPAMSPRLGPLTIGTLPLRAVGVPFGRLTAAQMRVLAEAAPEIRLTPWRSLLLPQSSGDLVDRLMQAGFDLDPASHLMSIAACTGAPGCASASRPSQDDARAVAGLIRPGAGIGLHVSGCSKGCAHPRAAPLTLVARDGRYDLILKGDTRGQPYQTGLDMEAVKMLLSEFQDRGLSD